LSGPTTYRVSENIGVLGNSQKQHIDVRKYFFDFKRWLDRSETITRLSNFAALPGQAAWGWQVDYPFASEPSDVPDTFPLILDESAILSGKTVSLMVASGTPGVSYLVSFLAIAGTGRAKQVDIVVSVAPPPITSPAPEPPVMPPTPPSMTIYETTALPAGTAGFIYISNVSTEPLFVTLPPSPVVGQTLTIKDITGNAGTYPITVVGGTAQIEGQPTLYMNFDYSWIQITYTGAEWVQV